MSCMTEKQEKCIQWICSTLGVKYYGKNDKYEASQFIGKFIDRAKEVQKENNFFSAWGISYFLGKPL